MQTQFTEKALGDCLNLVIDHRGKTPKKLGADWIDAGIPTISAKNVNGGRLVSRDSIRHVSFEVYKRWMKEDVKRGDCFLVSEGATLGECMLWDYDYPIVLGQRIFCLRANPVILNPKFLYAYMTSQSFQDEIIGRATGTSVDGLRQTEVLKLKLRLPPIEQQELIGDVLYNLDHKIELNRRMNATLEAMARALFQSWFVDFDPVRAKLDGRKPVGMDAVTANLFPSALQDSPLGQIPKGWEVKTADEISKVGIGKTPPRLEHHWFSENPADVPWMSIRDLGIAGVFITHTSEFLTAEAVDKFRVKRIPDNTVVLSFKLTMGRVAITDGEMLSNEAIAHFCLNPETSFGSAYFYCYLKGFGYDQLGSTSSIATAINSDMVRGIRVLVPPKAIAEAFERTIKPLFTQMKNIQKQSRTLATLRDTLLPKLLSGEIDMKGLGNQVEAVS